MLKSGKYNLRRTSENRDFAIFIRLQKFT